jgi:hypothetical protein
MEARARTEVRDITRKRYLKNLSIPLRFTAITILINKEKRRTGMEEPPAAAPSLVFYR